MIIMDLSTFFDQFAGFCSQILKCSHIQTGLSVLILFLNLQQVQAQNAGSRQDSLDYYYEQVVQHGYTNLDAMLIAIGKFREFVSPENKSELSQYYSLKGIYFQQKSQYDSAIQSQKLALELGLEAGDSLRISKAFQRLGVNYKYLGDFDTAIEYFIQAKDIFYEIGDYKSGATSDVTIAQCFIFMGKYEEGLKQLSPVIVSSRDLNEGEVLYAALIERGNVYLMTGALDSALEDYQEAIEVMSEIGKTEGISAIYGNIGGVYFYKGDFQLAIKNYIQSIELARGFGDQISLATATMNLAEALFTTGKFDEAKDSLLNTLKVYKALDSKHHIVYNYDYLYQLETKRAQYQEAIEYLKLKNVYQDSILNENTLNKISELQTKYQTAEKEQQIANQKLEITEKEAALQWKRIQLYGLVGGLVILLLFAWVFYNQYRTKQNAKLQAAILSEKERGFETLIQATEEERNRISKDLHDGIGQQLSALKMALKNISSKVSDEAQREDLEMITDQFSKSADEVRQISHQMMPRKLMENGLVAAIEDLLQSSFQFSEVNYTFEHHKVDQRFAERIEISLYRVLQELINNIIKHAEASQVSVQLIQNKDKLLLFVEDNGKGMEGKNADGHGLINIKSRLDMVKGSVNYEPSPGSGTSATVSVPIE